MTRHPRTAGVLGAVLIALLSFPLVFPGATAEEPAAPDDATVVDSSYEAPDGSRVLRQSIVVPATLEEVWQVFTTAEGWKSFAVPFAQVDFEVGGVIETSYDPRAVPGAKTNIRNRILSYLPLHMLSLQAEQAPPGFPAPHLLDELHSVLQFEALDDARVRVTVCGVGYRDGKDYERIESLFRQGNAWTLLRLRQQFAK